MEHVCIPEDMVEDDRLVRCKICGRIMENDDSKPVRHKDRPRWADLPPPNWDDCET